MDGTSKPRRKGQHNPAKRAMLRNRRIASGSAASPGPAGAGSHGSIGGQSLHVLKSDSESKSREPHVTLGSIGTFYHPAHRIARAIAEALDPAAAPGKCRTLADMTEEEKAAIASRYGAALRKAG